MHNILIIETDTEWKKHLKHALETLYSLCFLENERSLAQEIETRHYKAIIFDLESISNDVMDLLRWLTSMVPYTSVIVTSQHEHTDLVVQSIKYGAFDFVTKPIDFTDLETTIERGLKEIRYMRDNLKQKNQLSAVQQDLDTASRIQQKILPQDFPAFPDRKEFEIYAEMHTAKEVGGDFYDYFFIDEKHLGFVIGDVSGKGVPASIYMAVSRTMLKAIASQLHDPAECLQTVNSMLIPESDLTTFVTVFYGVLNTETGHVKYCNGGHNLPYHVKEDGSVVQVENTEGLLLGKIEPIQFQTKEIQLNPGDKIFLYTDGLTEAMNENDELYEDERVEQYLRTHSKDSDGKLLRGIIVDTLKFMNKAHQSDDITLLVLEYKGGD